MSVEIGSLRSGVEADRYGCIAAIGFDRAYQRAMTVRIRRSSISCESRHPGCAPAPGAIWPLSFSALAASA